MEICEFLKSWKRLCNAMTEMNGCEDCPIVRNTHNARCGDMPGEMQDVESIAREVEKWAAEHPEPVYPTWYEYLEKVFDPEVTKYPDDAESFFYAACNSRIKADTAEKLGIEPKEG